jgi:hypothetical protein
MRLDKIRSCVGVWALVLGFVAFTCGELPAETEENERWSIDFGSVSISEAFDQLTRITGIKISTTTPLAHTISPKRYVNQSIDQILKDVLKNMNYAAVWLYGKRGLESIGILAFDRERGEGPVALSGVERTGTMNRSLPRSPGPRQLRPSRQVSGPERASRHRVLQKPEQGSSAGLTDKKDSEIEEKDEEPVSPATEANDTSTPASSDSQVESTTGSSNEEEASSTEPQDKDEESGLSTSAEKKRGEEE